MTKLLQKFPHIKNSGELFKMFKRYNGDVVDYMKKSHGPDRVDYYIMYAAEQAMESILDKQLEGDPYTNVDESRNKK